MKRILRLQVIHKEVSLLLFVGMEESSWRGFGNQSLACFGSDEVRHT